MKNILFFVCALLIVACNKAEDQDKKHDFIPAELSWEERSFAFPEGTRFVEKTDKEGNRLEFYLPENYILIGITDDKIVRLPPGGGSITCSCDHQGGCSPVYYKGRAGCEARNCESCTMKSSLGKPDGSWQEVDFFFITQKTSENSLDKDFAEVLESTPIYDPQIWTELSFVTPEELDSPAFKRGLKVMDEWIADAKEYIEAGDDQREILIPWKINSKKMLVPVSYASLKLIPDVLVVALPPGALHCSGKCDGGRCTLSGGVVKTCSGCDSGCTLHY